MLLPLYALSLGSVQGRVHAMGTRNRSLARVVDEIPDFPPPVPPPTSECLLVFFDLEDLIPVCWVAFGV